MCCTVARSYEACWRFKFLETNLLLVSWQSISFVFYDLICEQSWYHFTHNHALNASLLQSMTHVIYVLVPAWLWSSSSSTDFRGKSSNGYHPHLHQPISHPIFPLWSVYPPRNLRYQKRPYFKGVHLSKAYHVGYPPTGERQSSSHSEDVSSQANICEHQVLRIRHLYRS